LRAHFGSSGNIRARRNARPQLRFTTPGLLLPQRNVGGLPGGTRGAELLRVTAGFGLRQSARGTSHFFEIYNVATFQSLILLLITIPGIDVLAARIVLSEIGRDMSRFPTAGHLLSWAGLCPRNDESAGKRRSTRLRKGDPWLKTLLVQCAWAARRKKGSYFNAQFLRLRGRRGPKKAACAVATSLLTTIYHMLKDGTQFAKSRCRSFRSPLKPSEGQTPCRPASKTWLRRQAHAPCPSSLRLLRCCNRNGDPLP
jgi:hypothetical protein